MGTSAIALTKLLGSGTAFGAARGPAFATTCDTPGLFTFGQMLGGWQETISTGIRLRF